MSTIDIGEFSENQSIKNISFAQISVKTNVDIRWFAVLWSTLH